MIKHDFRIITILRLHICARSAYRCCNRSDAGAAGVSPVHCVARPASRRFCFFQRLISLPENALRQNPKIFLEKSHPLR